MNPTLAIDRVTCVRERRTLFADVSFELAAGGAAVVTGPNGVGKSSLVRIAAGLLTATEGSVTLSGTRALLTEALALDPELPLRRALAFWHLIDGRATAIDAALEAFDLAALGEVPVRLLSTGQRKRAGLARVAASGAGIWLLDEPANGLDVAAIVLLEATIARHRAAGGIVLVATHQPLVLPDAQTIDLGAAAC